MVSYPTLRQRWRRFWLLQYYCLGLHGSRKFRPGLWVIPNYIYNSGLGRRWPRLLWLTRWLFNRERLG